MSIGMLLVTHPGLGQNLLETACALLGHCPLQTACIEVQLDGDVDAYRHQIHETIQRLDQGEGVLVLTDAFGATPSNIACLAAERQHAVVVSGLNLPMLIRIFNYANVDLRVLATKAAEGAARGIQVALGDV